MAPRNVELGTETVLTHSDLVKLYGYSIGDGAKIGPFVEIQKKNCRDDDRCKIICEDVTIENESSSAIA